MLVPDDASEPLLDWETQVGTGVYADVTCAREREFLDDADVTNTLTFEIKKHAIRIVRD